MYGLKTIVSITGRTILWNKISLLLFSRGQIKTREDGEGRHAFLKADGKYTLDTAARGSLKDPKDTDFVATNERFDLVLNPQSQNEHEGTGTLSYSDKVLFHFP